MKAWDVVGFSSEKMERFFEMDMVERFRKDVAEHELTIVNEAGLFRHITLKKPESFNYHFHITTWPGYLAISGDAGCYVFARLPDMFQFFRGDGVNPSYWSEKVQAADRHGAVHEFSAALSDQAGGWRDISTAKRDGTEIILLIGGHAVSGRWLESAPGYVGSGWVTLESREGFYNPDVPRGWMPMPSAPSTSGGVGK